MWLTFYTILYPIKHETITFRKATAADTARPSLLPPIKAAPSIFELATISKISKLEINSADLYVFDLSAEFGSLYT